MLTLVMKFIKISSIVVKAIVPPPLKLYVGINTEIKIPRFLTQAIASNQLNVFTLALPLSE
jgi:hypothetical protein